MPGCSSGLKSDKAPCPFLIIQILLAEIGLQPLFFGVYLKNHYCGDDSKYQQCTHHISAGIPTMKMLKPKTYPKTCFMRIKILLLFVYLQFETKEHAI